MCDTLQPLSRRQAEVLLAIHEWCEGCIAVPTVRELASFVGISVGSVFPVIQTLREKGYLTDGPKIELTAPAENICRTKVIQRPENHQRDESAIDKLVRASNVATDEHDATQNAEGQGTPM